MFYVRPASGPEATAVVADEASVDFWNLLNGRKEIGFAWHFAFLANY